MLAEMDWNENQGRERENYLRLNKEVEDGFTQKRNTPFQKI